MMQFILNIDQSILLWIQDVIRNPVLDPLFIFITNLGNFGIVWIVTSIIFLISPKTRRAGAMAIITLIAIAIVNNAILKNIIARIRPYEVIGNLKLMINEARDFSFPSGHTCSSVAMAYIMYKELPKRFGISAIILACLISFSRLYIGIHYPTDVLGGAILGIIIALSVRKLFFKVWQSEKKHKEEPN